MYGGHIRLQLTVVLDFFLTIVDDHSRMCWLYLMRMKSDVFSSLKSFLMLVKTQFNKQVKKLRTDNGTKFLALNVVIC